MAFYIATSNHRDYVKIEDEAMAGLCPRHCTIQLARAVSATIVEPGDDKVMLADKLRSKLAGTPETWALARRLRGMLRPGDVVFCPDEAIGIPIASVCGGRGARIIQVVHNITGPRRRLALSVFGVARGTDLFMMVAETQARFLTQTMGVPQSRIEWLCDQTDIHFFTPGEPLPKARPVIASVGLEKRDYRTLAAATADLDLDVRISGFSMDAQVLARSFPEQMPANMSKAFYSWPDLRDLYRTADIAVVSLFPNSYAAGIQGMLEATACGRPVIVTRTEGLAEYLDRPDLITTVAPGDVAGMRAAIQAKLADPDAAERQAVAARAHFLPLIDSDAYVATIAERMRASA